MRLYSSIITSRPRKHPRTIEDIPVATITEWSIKLFGLMNLTWDYIDTICDLCIGMRMAATKSLVRTVRTLKREYDRFRWSVMDRTMEENERHHGLRFEERFREDFNRMFNGIEMDINRLDLIHDHKMLVIAVQQALTLMDAVKKYARWCDRQISAYGVAAPDCCMVQKEFLRLYPLIPEFAGDCYQPDLKTRRLTADILVNRLREVSLDQLLDKTEIQSLT